jgi:hypothetical protein
MMTGNPQAVMRDRLPQLMSHDDGAGDTPPRMAPAADSPHYGRSQERQSRTARG